MLSRAHCQLAATLALLVALAGGAYACIDPDGDRRRAAASDLNEIRMALEGFSTDHNGAYPEPAAVPRALIAPREPYFRQAVPPNRWGGPGLLLGARGKRSWPAGLPSARDLARGQIGMPKVGTVLGPGHLPGEGPADALTYGAVLYDHDPDLQIYVVYVIGRQGDQAVVSGATSNTSC